MLAPLARLIARLHARQPRAGRGTSVRLRVDRLEGRDVPAVWMNYTGDHDANNPANWDWSGEWGSQIQFAYFVGAADGGCDDPCDGLAGSFTAVSLADSYSGTVTLGGPLTTWWLYQGNGVLDQPLGDDSPIRVLQAWGWKGGTLNSTATPSTITVDGSSGWATASIYPAGGGAVNCGSAIVFDAGTEAEIDAQVNLTNPTGIDVLGGSGLTLADGTAILSALTALEQRQTIRVFGTLSRLFTQGAATADLGLWVDGGTAELQGSATQEVSVTFRGPVRQANGDPPPGLAANDPASVYMTSGRLIIGEGGRLVTQTRDVLIRGGKLATRVTVGNEDHQASIAAGFLIVEQAAGATTEVVICDPSFNPPGVNGYEYGELSVYGSVAWRGGTYRPLLNLTTNGKPSSLWFATEEFLFGDRNNPGGGGPVLGPTSGQQLPPVNTEYLIISSGTRLFRRITPTFEAGNTNWIVKNPNNPDVNFIIKRT